MKPLAVLIFLLGAWLSSSSQAKIHSFAEIDSYAARVKVQPARELAHQLTYPYLTDREKVRSIFSWIAGNISYRVRKRYISQRSVVSEAALLEQIDSCRCKSANEIVAEAVLLRGEAVCEGYAKLFKTLCEFSGIRSAIITGFGRTNMPRYDNALRSNHSWNAVYVDSSWHLLDVTWASGYTSYFGDQFIQHFNDKYFFTSPEVFIEDHIPDDMRWTLLTQPPVASEYATRPFRQKPFVKYNIASYAPSTGVLRAKAGDTLNFQLEIAAGDFDKKIAADTSGSEVSLLPEITGATFLVPKIDGRKIYYSYVPEDAGVRWISLLYNNDAILRYRVVVEKGL